MLNEKEKSNDHNDWLENSNKSFEYSNFEIMEQIGFGSFGKVFRANLKDHTDTIFALKIFNTEFALKNVVNEVQIKKFSKYCIDLKLILI